MARLTIRRILPIAVGLALVAVAAVAIPRLGADDEPAVVAAPPLEAVEVTVGDLTSTERIDGTIEETHSITVLHRIDGATSTTTQSQTAAAGTTATASVTPAGLTAVASSEATATLDVALVAEPVCPPTTTAAPTTTTTAPTGSTAPAAPTTTSPDPGCATTTTTPAPETTTTAPETTTTTTTPQTATTTSTPAGAIPSGPGGARASTGGVGNGPSGSSGPGTVTGATSSEPATQLVTSISPTGSTITLGDPLYTVDGTPVVAMRGALPAWRTMESGIDDGTDVQQLEQSLVDLGYDPDGDITVDAEFDADTTAAVERWQEGLGVEATGVVTLGSIVFVAADTTVTGQLAAVGDEVGDGSAMVTLSGNSYQVVIVVPTELQSIIAPGLDVDLGGPRGTVTLLRSAEQDASTVVQALITPLTVLEGAVAGDPVTVAVGITSATGATIVPAEALLSRLDGTYAVQVGDPDGPHQFIAVQVLAVSGGDVAIESDGLEAGMTVLVPA